MKKNLDINREAFSVRCTYYTDKDAGTVTDIVVATYGFGGNRDNQALRKFAERLISKDRHFAVLVFDWPCHGEDARNRMILSEFLEYYRLAVDYAREELGAKRLYAFGTSLGGYMALLYLQENGNPFTKICLKAPALHIYENLASSITDDEWRLLGRHKDITRGFGRKIKLSQDFLEEIKAHDVYRGDFLKYADDIFIVAGGKDEYTREDDIKSFCEANVIDYEIIENADHPFTDPVLMDRSISDIIGFFLA